MAEASLIVEIATLLIGVPSAVVAFWQALSARKDRVAAEVQAKIAMDHSAAAQASAEAADRQARAAEHQNDLGKQQLEEMRKANAREMEAREEAKLQNSVHLELEVKSKVDMVAGEVRLLVVVQNSGRAEAVIQTIYVEHEDGTKYAHGSVFGHLGDLNKEEACSKLPGRLAYGGRFTFQFVRVGGGINLARDNPTFKRDKIVRIVVVTPSQKYARDNGPWLDELRKK